MLKLPFKFKKTQKEKPERQQPMTAEGKRQMRRRRQTRRTVWRVVIVVLIVALAVVV